MQVHRRVVKKLTTKEELREQLQSYSKPKLVEMCIKLLRDKELSERAATYDELLEMDWNK